MLNEHQGKNSQSCLSPGENSRGSGEHLPGKGRRMKMAATETKHTGSAQGEREQCLEIAFG